MFKPNYKLTNKVVNYISKISSDREIILNSPILPYIESRLKKDALISRTHHSTSIEGNPLQINDVAAIVDGQLIKTEKKAKQEIINYVNALKYLDQIADKKAITEATILKLHFLITKNILLSKNCGKYRDRMVYVIDSFGRTVFTPPNEKDVPPLVRDLSNWLNSQETKNIHPVLLAGIVHYELVRIHPFIDGNGRTARILATYILYKFGFDIKHFFALDDYYNENRQAYYSALEYIDPKARDLTQWLEYFIEGVAVQISKLKDKVESLTHEPLFKKMKKKILLKDRQWKLLEKLKTSKKISNLDYQKLAGISREMAKRDLAFLVKEKILLKSGSGRGVFYRFNKNNR